VDTSVPVKVTMNNWPTFSSGDIVESSVFAIPRPDEGVGVSACTGMAGAIKDIQKTRVTSHRIRKNNGPVCLVFRTAIAMNNL
jgi:hypothetical protein